MNVQPNDPYIEDLDTEPEGHQPPPLKRFRIMGEVFSAAGECPAGALFDMAAIAATTDTGDAATARKMAAIPAFLDAVIMPESAVRFAKLMRDPERPLTMERVNRVLSHLIRVYGGRPTEQSSHSSGGLGGIGSNSTDGAQLVVSTPGL